MSWLLLLVECCLGLSIEGSRYWKEPGEGGHTNLWNVFNAALLTISQAASTPKSPRTTVKSPLKAPHTAHKTWLLPLISMPPSLWQIAPYLYRIFFDGNAYKLFDYLCLCFLFRLFNPALLSPEALPPLRAWPDGRGS